MQDINHTPTRHKMLAAVSSGCVTRHAFVGVEPIWVDPTSNAAYKAENVRALARLWATEYIGPDDDGRTNVAVTEDGQQLLAAWDAEHPANGKITEFATPFKIAGSSAFDRSIVVANDDISLHVSLASPAAEFERVDRIARAIVATLNGEGAQA